MRTALLVLFATGAGLSAQHVTIADGPAGNRDIRILDESNPAGSGTTLLQGVAFLPIERTARTADQHLRRDVPRRRSRQGLLHLEVPGARRLFHYRRGDRYGLLWIEGDGDARVVLERAGTGPGGATSPFADRVGIADDGRHLAVPGLFGDLHLVRLDGSVYSSTGTPVRTVTTGIVEPASVLVGPTHVFFQTDENNGTVWRCPLADGATPTDVTPAGPTGAFPKEEMAMSGDGSRVAFLFGPKDLFTLYLMGTSGAAVALPPQPAKYEEPDYLPEGPGHPELLLDHRGDRLFFVDSTVRDELFLLDTSGVLPTRQITDNATFQPYIGVSIYPRFAAGNLTIAIGDIDRMDWFSVDGTGNVSNLTATGTAQPPYAAGTLDPTDLASFAGGGLVAAENSGANLRLRHIDPATGQQRVLLDGATGAPQPGDSFGAPVEWVVDAPRQRLLDGTTGQPLVALPAGVTLTPPATGPTGTLRATLVALGPVQIPLVVAGGTTWTGRLATTWQQLVLTSGGGAMLNDGTLRYLAPGVLTTMPTSGTPVVLSGAGI